MAKKTKTFRVGEYMCEMTADPNTFAIGVRWTPDWSPTDPNRHIFSAAELAQYRAGRNLLLQELTPAGAGDILIIEA
jgi:hypothetical protein